MSIYDNELKDVRIAVNSLTQEQQRAYFHGLNLRRGELMTEGQRNVGVEDRLKIIEGVKSGEVCPPSDVFRNNSYGVKDSLNFHRRGEMNLASRDDIYQVEEK